MSSFDIPVDDITDRAAFRDALTRLIERAEANSIDIRGGYQYDGLEGEQDYGIEIYRVGSADD